MAQVKALIHLGSLGISCLNPWAISPLPDASLSGEWTGLAHLFWDRIRWFVRWTVAAIALSYRENVKNPRPFMGICPRLRVLAGTVWHLFPRWESIARVMGSLTGQSLHPAHSHRGNAIGKLPFIESENWIHVLTCFGASLMPTVGMILSDTLCVVPRSLPLVLAVS